MIAAAMLIGLDSACGSKPKGTNAIITYREGQAEAQKDIQAGRLTGKTYGLSASSGTRYAKMLREEYDVELKAVGGYGVTSELFQKVRGYNECSRAEIERRFLAKAC